MTDHTLETLMQLADDWCINSRTFKITSPYREALSTALQEALAERDTEFLVNALEALQAEVALQKEFRDDIREAHESMIVRIGEMCGTDLSSEPRAKWALIEVSSLIAERDSLRSEVARLKEQIEQDGSYKESATMNAAHIIDLSARLTALEDRLYTVYAALGDALFELKVGNTYTTATDSYKANNELIHRLDIVMNGQYVSRALAAGAAPTHDHDELVKELRHLSEHFAFTDFVRRSEIIKQAADALVAQAAPDYAALEKEHLGDPDLKTGSYYQGTK